MKTYTLGFIFTPALDHVLLIHKISPAWQAGRVNGIGGKIEEGEHPLACIVREIREETALLIDADAWISLGEMGSDTWHMHVFTTVYNGSMHDAKSADKEKIEWFSPDVLPLNALSNLAWLVPLARDKIRCNEVQYVNVTYH